MRHGFIDIVRGLTCLVVGFGAVVGMVFFTIDLSAAIGFLTTITIYLVSITVITGYLIRVRVKRNRIGWEMAQIDTEAADESGSTARFGVPHDPYAAVPDWHPGRRPRPWK